MRETGFTTAELRLTCLILMVSGGLMAQLASTWYFTLADLALCLFWAVMWIRLAMQER